MSLGSFIYRQQQKLRYRLSSSETERNIRRINMSSRRVAKTDDHFVIEGVIRLPKGKFDYIFRHFDLFITNRKTLKGEYRISEDKLLFEFSGIKVQIGSESDLIVIEEIFIKNCYNFFIPGASSIAVVDIGMNTGIASLFFAMNPLVSVVHSYEPFSQPFQAARYNFTLNAAAGKKINPQHAGLGRRDEQVKAGFNASNTALNSVLENGAGADGETLNILEAGKELEKIFHLESGKDLVLKIDCEGSEFGIFESAFEKTIHPSVKVILLEWHDKSPEPLQQVLLKNNFKLVSVNITEKVGVIYAMR